VRPASHILEYFDPPQTVCRCPRVWLHFPDSPLEEDDDGSEHEEDRACDRCLEASVGGNGS
jgi:hypothetical protein